MSIASAVPPRRRATAALKVVVTRRLLPGTEERMRALFDAALNPRDEPLGPDGLARALADCDVLVPCVTDAIGGELIARAGPNLGLIAGFGAGTEHIDLTAAHARGIAVTNTPDVFTEDTADLAMTLILLAMRRFAQSGRILRSGGWQGWGPSVMLGASLGGKRLGIVGMGGIGRAVAHRARSFGLEIAYHNRRRLPPAVEAPLGAQYEPDLDRLVAQADIVSLHCPAGAETLHLMDARRFALMKPGAVLVNSGRGSLVDEDALVAALEAGRIAGAALDVFANEPQIDPRLLAQENLVALPHLGSATREGREAAGLRIVENILAWAAGGRPPDLVEPA